MTTTLTRSLAEDVLERVLQAEAVGVDEIRAALEELRREPSPPPEEDRRKVLEEIATSAQYIALANDAIDTALNDDSADPDYDALFDPIRELVPLLERLRDCP